MTVAVMLEDLMRGFVAGAAEEASRAIPAKAAKVANRERGRGFSGDADACEALRIGAKPEPAAVDSQAFAAIRSPGHSLESEHGRGLSQDSQDSQGPAAVILSDAELAAVAWTEVDIARFLSRQDRLMRWGWPAAEAERMAERLVARDRAADTRVSCVECRHYRPGRCGNHRSAELSSPDIGRDLAGLLQRCAGFKEAT